MLIGDIAASWRELIMLLCLIGDIFNNIQV